MEPTCGKILPFGYVINVQINLYFLQKLVLVDHCSYCRLVNNIGLFRLSMARWLVMSLVRLIFLR